eukprot:15304702-Alexandrium_andersonii.AAC.1
MDTDKDTSGRSHESPSAASRGLPGQPSLRCLGCVQQLRESLLTGHLEPKSTLCLSLPTPSRTERAYSEGRN